MPARDKGPRNPSRDDDDAMEAFPGADQDERLGKDSESDEEFERGRESNPSRRTSTPQYDDED